MILFLVVFLLILISAPFAIEARRKSMGPEARREAPGEFIELSLGVTHFQWHGPVRGPIAVCVHGLTTPSFVWQGLVPGLTAMGYRVLTYDLYGRGYSDRPKDPQTADFFITQLEELLATQDITEDITLIGYSMGGAIATSYAAKHPHRVRHLVLLASAGMILTTDRMAKYIRKTPVIGDWLMMAFFPSRHRTAAEAERDLPSSVPNIVDLQQRELNYRGFIKAILSSLRNLLAQDQHNEHKTIYRAGVPVLAIWGRQDSVIPIRAMGMLTEWSRTTRQEVIEDAGHSLAYTHSDEIIQILQERLRDGLN
ncbi:MULTISPECIES: alpha/beta fold hydrolase [Roseobacteraceae]|uniref:Alpha/beta fold hydrolase n=1 Tax=Falsiruegeria litorea TaxID=1280831 RepID=A0ABS5WSF3_9RHOB|nr:MULTISPECIES: alpha/beta hydrolase [Roseobacteraceae]MBT3142055.1 alpha/beta fold hydrolase [Falsiruegeria litorea]MBT8168599.1 alpha/beta fold hydrolase [Falsiruegeria litorea]